MTKSAAIVGAGVGGLATAVGLHRAGWRGTVLERWPEVVEVGAALGLWPQAQSALARIGMGEQVQAQVVPYRSAVVRTPSGRRLGALPLAGIERRGGAPVVIISRRTLLRLLLEASREVDVRTGMEISDAAALQADHDLVVGADGVRSAVREAYFPGEAAPRDAGFVAWRGAVDAESAVWGETWGRGQLFGVTPMEPGRANWYAAVALDGAYEDSYADLTRRYAGWPDPVPRLLAATAEEDVLRHGVVDLSPTLRSYVHGSVVLVGDAAHAMTPTLGQGACQALIDAATLVECVGAGEDVAAGLRRYDRVRRRATQRMVRGSRVASRLALSKRFLPARDALAVAGLRLAR